MKSDIAGILQKRKKQMLELWMKNQLVDFSLREDLISISPGMGYPPRGSGLFVFSPENYRQQYTRKKAQSSFKPYHW